jgi:hypothetical protein
MITIISRDVVYGGMFAPDIFRFHVSETDANSIIASHFTLVLNIGETTNINPSVNGYPWSELYIGATVDPYGLVWAIADNGLGDFSINFMKTLQSPFFDDINLWSDFNVNVSPIPVDPISNNAIHEIIFTPRKYAYPTIENRDYLITEDNYFIITEDNKKIRL